MDEIYKKANAYHRKLESFRAYGGVSHRLVWMLLIFCFFGAAITGLLGYALPSKSWWVFYAMVVVALLLEFLLFIAMNRLREHRDTIFIREVEEIIGRVFNSPDAARIALLEEYFDCSSKEFLKKAEEIDAAMRLLSPREVVKTKFDLFFEFLRLSSGGSKLLTLFVLFSSIITVLSVSAGQDIESVYGFYDGENVGHIFFVVLFLALLAAMFKTIFDQFVDILNVIIVSISSKFIGKRTFSVEAVRYLIRDMVRLNSFGKMEAGLSLIGSSKAI